MESRGRKEGGKEQRTQTRDKKRCERGVRKKRGVRRNRSEITNIERKKGRRKMSNQKQTNRKEGVQKKKQKQRK